MSGKVATTTTLYKPEVNDFALHRKPQALAQAGAAKGTFRSQQKPDMISSATLTVVTFRTAKYAHLDLYKLSFALVTDLEEGFTRHCRCNCQDSKTCTPGLVQTFVCTCDRS